MNQSQGILKAGELLNNTYVIEELVGSGGTGEVYRAKNMVSGREFAIKILKQEFANDEAFINLMRREADVLHNVIDDAVVRYNELLRSEMHGGFVFLVMEFIRGPQLADIVRERGPVGAESLMLVARRMGKGLKAAHEQNAFHRDMSPDNIILPGGDPAKAKLIDFGIARDISENAETVVGGGFAGKYQFAAPEQLDGNVDARSDLYSLGMTLLNAHRGKPINVGSSLMEIVKSKSQRPDTRDVPGRLGALISRLVEPDPADRFQSAAEMLAWIDGGPAAAPLGEEKTVIMPRPGASAADRHPISLQPEPSGGGGKGLFILLLLAVLAGGGWYFGMGSGKDMIFGPAYPLADPYRIEIASAGGAAPVRVSGHMPDPESGAAVDAALAAAFDPATVQSTYDFASGAPVESWANDIVQLATTAIELAQWDVVVVGNTVRLSGQADGRADADAVIAAATRVAQGLGYTLEHEINVSIQPLDLVALDAEMQVYASCGQLRVSGGDGLFAGPDDTITVSGIVARQGDIDALDLVLNERVDGRDVAFNMAVLNESVCLIDSMLPVGKSGGIEVEFSYGRKEGEVIGGVYHDGENPVIDLMIPAAYEGFLYAFYIDSSRRVNHLLPHQARQGHTLPAIGDVEGIMRRVRVTYPASEVSAATLGFGVVEPYGTNMIVAVLSPTPLFDGLRPRAESLEAFHEALVESVDILEGPQTLIVRRYLVTEE